MRTTHLLIATTLLVSCKGANGKEAGVEVFGTRPTPPGELAKIKEGMTQAEVKALLPSAKPTPNHSGSPSLSIDSGYSNLEYRIGFYSDKDAVADVEVIAPKSMDLVAKLEKAWGPGKDAHAGDKAWINEEGGYEVQTMDMGRRTHLSYRPFVPLDAAFFGTQPGPVDALAKVKFGMTRDEVKAAVPGLEGPPKGGGSYVPYRAKPRDVTLDVSFDYQDDKLDRMEMRMPKRGVELMAKAWGAPKIGKTRGTGDPMHCWDSADKSMRIELTPDGDPVNVSFVPPGKGFCELPE